jgi:tagatose 6-phosphate kinase
VTTAAQADAAVTTAAQTNAAVTSMPSADFAPAFKSGRQLSVIGLSPAWQQIALLDRLLTGEVNRASQWLACASGKGLNVALALATLTRTPEPWVAAGVLPATALTDRVTVRTLSTAGGHTGEQLRAEFTHAGGEAEFFATRGATRTCTTLLDRSTRRATEIVENAPPLEPDELARLIALALERAATADVLVLAGSLPAGAPADLYATLARACPGRVLVDAQGPLLLATLPARPYVIKPNREELARSLGQPLETDAQLHAGLDQLHARGAHWIVVSQGAGPVWISGPNHRSRCSPPVVEVVNPIGSGDCLAAGLAWGLALGLEPPLAIRVAIAAAADNATRLLPARIDPHTAAALAVELRVENAAP